jgi:formamidopyrimidine-DNA glycosylase
MTEASFQKILSRSARPIKTIVMDSQKIGGIGNIYANDGLFLAGINPSRKANSLSNQESQKLLKALKQVINKGIKLGGATASDDKFVQVSGMGGKYQEHFLTYEREGQKCKRKSCPGTIVKTRLGGRGTYFCPICQPVNE